MNTDQIGFFLNLEKKPKLNYLQLHNLIEDRGSKYSVTASLVENEQELNNFLKKLKSDKRYQQASHNSYATKFKIDDKVIELKSDDGETGAGMIILRSIRKSNLINVVIVVTRWFGGTPLYNDRFKHIQDSTQEILKKIS